MTHLVIEISVCLENIRFGGKGTELLIHMVGCEVWRS
jgi:hypothetical protein